MKRADLCCWCGSTVIGGGLYLLHPAAACLWAGAVLVALGVLLHRKEKAKQ